MSDHNRNVLTHFADILSPADQGILCLIGDVLDLRQLSEAAAVELVRETRRRASRKAAEARFDREVRQPS